MKRNFTGGDGDGTASPNPANTTGGGGGSAGSPPETLTVGPKPTPPQTGIVSNGIYEDVTLKRKFTGATVDELEPTPPPTPPPTVLVSVAVETTGIKSNSMHEDGGRVISSHLTSSNLISSHLYYRPRQLLNTIRQI